MKPPAPGSRTDDAAQLSLVRSRATSPNSSAAAPRKWRARRSTASDRDMGRVFVLPRQSQRRCIRERWRHTYGCGRWFNLVRNTVTHEIARRLRHRRTAAMTVAPIGRPQRHAARSYARNPLVRVQRPGLQRLSWRYAGLGAARERRAARRPQLQTASAARHLLLRRRRADRARRCGAGPTAHAECARHACWKCTHGLAAESVNCWPSVGFDLGADQQLVFRASCPPASTTRPSNGPIGICSSPAFAAWRDSAAPPADADPDRYEEIAVSADVLVVGGGLAGLAPLSPRREAAQTSCCSSGSARLGGLLGCRSDERVAALDRGSATRCGVRILTRTLAFGIYDHNLVCARQTLGNAGGSSDAPGVLRERLWKIRARAVIAAAGAFERPMIFPNNDRPGVMLAGAAEKYAHAYGVACGSRVVIAANSDPAYRVAASLRGLGIEVLAIVDCRPDGDDRRGSAAGGTAAGSCDAGFRGFPAARGARLHVASSRSAARRALRLRPDLERRRPRARRASAFPGRRQTALARRVRDVRAGRTAPGCFTASAPAPASSRATPR